MSDQNKKSEVAKREEKILDFWRENQIFEKTLSKDAPKGEFVFYDGPPFATGLPHYGHILPGTIKDVIPRFKTMQGYHVERQWGWDTHGLPLENQVEDHLDLETKKDISEYGIEKFNNVAKDFVLQYAEDWKRIIPRTGRWVNMDDDYRTMDASYTESIWWAFGELDKKGHIYEGFKSMHVCPRCETPLSNFEVNQGYVEQKDISVTVKLPLVDKPDISLLIWTTTPWTLPGNMAVAVNPELTYTTISHEGKQYIVAKEMLEDVFADKEYEVIESFLGQDLVGKKYLPPFDYYQEVDIENKQNAWQVYGADFVTLEEGTGLVHIAPAFGADDLSLAEENGIPIVHHVTISGEFTEEVTDFAGMKVKPRDEGEEEHLSADIEILKYLLDKDLLFAKENIHHQYPLCWRCDTPLLNYATSSWFVEVSKFKDKLVSENKKVDWVPEAVGSNRFGNWLEGARDWAISRERFWGAPLPVWKSSDGEVVEVIGSLDELKEKTQSTNTFFAMRHGGAEHNAENRADSGNFNTSSLTEEGRKEAAKAASGFKMDIDVIYASPYARTQQTAEIIIEELGLDKDIIVTDERIGEFDFGEFDGKPISEYRAFREAGDDDTYYTTPATGGESHLGAKQRVGEFMYDINSKHESDNILIISHGIFLEVAPAVVEGADLDRSIELLDSYQDRPTGTVIQLDFTPLPHNEDYELDLHRPYIDEITWENKDGQKMERIDSVFDCWFESGSMPYASKHYPFAEDSGFDPKSDQGYPANFVAEGLDQTRGWFYSSLVLGVGLFDKSPYQNVVVNGLVLAEDGRKMSKSKQNYPPVSDIIDNQGADALRFFLINSPLVRGENVSLSKDEVDEVVKKVMHRLTNSYSFVEMYTTSEEREEALERDIKVDNILDQWILARLNLLIQHVTDGLESYQIDKAAKPLVGFIDDLSTWYVRRSRDRIRGDEGDDRNQSIKMTLYVLQEVSKVLAPFMPFLAETLYQDVTLGQGEESVHLADWPQPTEEVSTDDVLLKDMAVLREAASHAHDLRSQAELKVRQPLALLTLRDDRLKGKVELLDILADEVNVQKIDFDGSIDQPAELDTDLTDDLKRKGVVRECIRSIQRLRKQADLDTAEMITLAVDTDTDGKKLLEDHLDEITQTANLSEISFTTVKEGAEVAEHNFTFRMEVL